MKLLELLPPHWHGADRVTVMMLQVLAALLPVIAVCTWVLGPGALLNVIFAVLACLALEAIALKLRGHPLAGFLKDGSATVTGVLLALALPPAVPWWVSLSACLFAIVFAKHLYGGIGYNVFNPAMAGYAVILIAFPQHLATWPTPAAPPDLAAAWAAFLGVPASGGTGVDIVSAATPLDGIKYQLGQMRTMREIMSDPDSTWLASRGWVWINLSALAGGLWLLRLRVIRWQIPVAMLGSMGLLYTLAYLADSATHVPPLLGLFSGGAMLGAFFIATDPVSAATTPRGRLIYAAGIGTLAFSIRQWGAYPDGIAFAVLLMNMAVPLIDRYTLPRVYGHEH